MADFQQADFVIMGLQSWDIEIGSNCKNIAMELAKNHRVLYINRALDRASIIRQRNDKKVKARVKALRNNDLALMPVMKNLWVLNPAVVLESINWVTSTRIFDRLNRINGVRLSRSINRGIAALDFKQTILFVDNDFIRGRYLKELVKNDLTVYYIRDYLTDQPYFKKHGSRLERALLKKADVSLANSSYLAQYASQYQTHAYDIGQGCDLTAFAQSPPAVPEDLLVFKKPIIGYVGALLSSRLDIDLIDGVAQDQPDWTIILVGPEDDAFKNSKLHQRANVHFLGEKANDQVPSYVYGFDVCINPQLVNTMTQGNYPRKIDEYLAAGKPVVATATETMRSFVPYVYLCQGVSDYISSIKGALQETNNESLRQQRKEFAFSHTWEKSVTKMMEYIQHVGSITNEQEDEKRR